VVFATVFELEGFGLGRGVSLFSGYGTPVLVELGPFVGLAKERTFFEFRHGLEFVGEARRMERSGGSVGRMS